MMTRRRSKAVISCRRCIKRDCDVNFMNELRLKGVAGLVDGNRLNLLTQRVSFSLAMALLVAALGTASVRAGEPAKSPEEAAARIRAVRTEVAITRSNVYDTLVQLHEIKGAGDPQAQFQKFTNQLVVMEQRGQFTRDLARQMQEKGDAYFVGWEVQIASIQDPDQRKFAESRYAQRKESYDAVKMFMKKAGRDFTPLLEALKQIEHLLKGKRTAENILAAKELFMNANYRCTDVQRALMQAELELDDLAAEFSGSHL